MQTITQHFSSKPATTACDEHKDPGENPHTDWPSATTPWEQLEQYTKCQIWKRTTDGMPTKKFARNHLLKSHPKRTVENLWWEFKEAPQDEMMKTFFTPAGKPRLFRLGQQFDWWIFWAVTHGFYRMDRNKRIFTYVAEGHPTILDFADSKGFWDKCSCGEGFPILAEITESCNRLIAAVLARFSRYQKRTKAVVCYLENIIRMPEMVMFQSYRGHDHKQFRWHYQAGPPAGGKTPRVAKPLQIPKQSVHWMMMNYHLWLHPIKNKQ